MIKKIVIENKKGESGQSRIRRLSYKEKIATGIITVGVMLPAVTEWVRAFHSGGGNCVEVANLGGNVRGVRDSKNPNSGILTVNKKTLKSLLNDIQQGKYS